MIDPQPASPIAGPPDALSSTPSAPLARRGGRRRRGLRPLGLPWILPAFILVVGLLYYCIGDTAYISTLDWDGVSPDKVHVGFGNYTQAYHDPVFWDAIRHTVVFFVVTFVVQTVVGFTFAAIVHSRIKLATLYKVIIFTPVVIAPATMAPVFRQVFAADGQFNAFLSDVGLSSWTQPWLAQSSTALAAVMAITVWQWTGVTFILYFAAMGQVEPEIIEAARIDGAGNIRTLAQIVWPSVRGTTVALGMLSVIGALKTFDVPYLVTVGGPNFATEFLGTMIYRISIPMAHVGYGAALSIILLVLALLGAIAIGVRGMRTDRTSHV